MRIRVNDNNRLPEIIKTIDELNGQKMNVGVLGEGEQQYIAGIHEYGVTYTVTKKQRGYLHHKGLHVGKTITIPERSFIRAGWDENEQDVLDKSDQMIPELINKGISVSAFLDALGQESADRIKDFARDLKNPANHPFTIEQKGSSNPLVDTGGMIEIGITYEII